MEDYQTMFRKIIEEHRALREQLGTAEESVSDRVAIDLLRRMRSDLTPGRAEILSEKMSSLQVVLGGLDKGLKSHFALESNYFPPFLGDLLMRALLLEHRGILERLNEARSTVTDVKVAGLSHEELQARDAQVKQAVNALSRAVGEHAAKEELLMGMLQKGFEDKGIDISR